VYYIEKYGLNGAEKRFGKKESDDEENNIV
jgi:hypothetical protein